MDLTAAEVRVLGCLVEKALATPQAYPLSLNALVTACNQSTNRDPVVAYDDVTVRDAVTQLRDRELSRTVYARSSRVPKYAHRLDETLGLDAARQAMVGLLALRGPQTAAELRARAERLHRFADVAAVEAVLAELAAASGDPAGPERPLVQRLPRRPGQKEDRFAHLLGGEQAAAAGERPAAKGWGFTHLVVFRFADRADADEAVQRLRGLAASVSVIRDLEVGVDATAAPASWTVALIVRLDDAAALPAYRDDPAHAEVAAWLKSRTTGRLAVDLS